jgi:hypothetical protein
MIEKAKAAKSAEELLELAKANGVEMTADEAATYFAQLNPKSGELDDDDLDAVAGGAGGCGDPTNKDLFPEGSKMRRKKGPCVCGNNVWIAKHGWSVTAQGNYISPTCSTCGRESGDYLSGARGMSDNFELIG